jgi:hypothetical protein
LSEKTLPVLEASYFLLGIRLISVYADFRTELLKGEPAAGQSKATITLIATARTDPSGILSRLGKVFLHFFRVVCCGAQSGAISANITQAHAKDNLLAVESNTKFAVNLTYYGYEAAPPNIAARPHLLRMKIAHLQRNGMVSGDYAACRDRAFSAPNSHCGLLTNNCHDSQGIHPLAELDCNEIRKPRTLGENDPRIDR